MHFAAEEVGCEEFKVTFRCNMKILIEEGEQSHDCKGSDALAEHNAG